MTVAPCSLPLLYNLMDYYLTLCEKELIATMEARLLELESLRSRGIISQQEYDTSRAAALVIAPPPAAPMAVALTPQAQCRFGHRMEWVNKVVGRFTEYGGVCAVCTRQIKKPDYFFHCARGTEEECMNGHIVCHECGLSGAEAQQPTQQRWQSSLCWDDVGLCLDSILCFHCLVAQIQYTTGNGGLPTDGSPPGFSCDCDRCGDCTFLIVMELFYLGFLFPLFSTRGLYQTAERKYSIRENDRHSCCETFCYGYFCRCCVAAEISREHAIRGNFPGGVCCTSMTMNGVASNYVPRRPLPAMGEAEADALMMGNSSSPAVPSPGHPVAPSMGVPIPGAPTLYAQNVQPPPPPPPMDGGVYGNQTKSNT